MTSLAGATQVRDRSSQDARCEADKRSVGAPCPGCEWLGAAVRERRQLAAELSRLGIPKLAQIAEHGIDALAQDWWAHIRRDHAPDTASLVRLRDALSPATADAVGEPVR